MTTTQEKVERQSSDMPPPLVKFRDHPGKWIFNKIFEVVATVIMVHIGTLFFVALYFLITQTTEPANDAWHWLVSDDHLRHNIRDVGEGLFGGLFGVAINWNHFRKIRPMNRIDRAEIFLHIPNVKDKRAVSFRRFLMLGPLVLVYGSVGFLATYYGLQALTDWVNNTPNVANLFDSAHDRISQNPSLLEREQDLLTMNWEVKLTGFVAALVFGRRPAKGFVDDLQLWFVERRIAQGKHAAFSANRPQTTGLRRWFFKRQKAKAKHPALYYPPTIRARFNHVRDAGYVTVDVGANRKGWQTVLIVASVPVVLGMAGWGWYIMNFIAK